MARTKQTARISTGGKAPRKPLAFLAARKPVAFLQAQAEEDKEDDFLIEEEEPIPMKKPSMMMDKKKKKYEEEDEDENEEEEDDYDDEEEEEELEEDEEEEIEEDEDDVPMKKKTFKSAKVPVNYGDEDEDEDEGDDDIEEEEEPEEDEEEEEKKPRKLLATKAAPKPGFGFVSSSAFESQKPAFGFPTTAPSFSNNSFSAFSGFGSTTSQAFEVGKATKQDSSFGSQQQGGFSFDAPAQSFGGFGSFASFGAPQQTTPQSWPKPSASPAPQLSFGGTAQPSSGFGAQLFNQLSSSAAPQGATATESSRSVSSMLADFISAQPYPKFGSKLANSSSQAPKHGGQSGFSFGAPSESKSTTASSFPNELGGFQLPQLSSTASFGSLNSSFGSSAPQVPAQSSSGFSFDFGNSSASFGNTETASMSSSHSSEFSHMTEKRKRKGPASFLAARASSPASSQSEEGTMTYRTENLAEVEPVKIHNPFEKPYTGEDVLEEANTSALETDSFTMNFYDPKRGIYSDGSLQIRLTTDETVYTIKSKIVQGGLFSYLSEPSQFQLVAVRFPNRDVLEDFYDMKLLKQMYNRLENYSFEIQTKDDVQPRADQEARSVTPLLEISTINLDGAGHNPWGASISSSNHDSDGIEYLGQEVESKKSDYEKLEKLKNILSKQGRPNRVKAMISEQALDAALDHVERYQERSLVFKSFEVFCVQGDEHDFLQTLNYIASKLVKKEQQESFEGVAVVDTEREKTLLQKRKKFRPQWRLIENQSILCFNLNEAEASSKIAGFDFDDTLVKPKSGAKFARDGKDWKYLYRKTIMVEKMQQLIQQGYKIVLFSNQMGVSQGKMDINQNLKKRIEKAFQGFQIDFTKVQGFCALKKDQFRKPNPNMWNFMKQFGNKNMEIDMSASFYVGDAAGRPNDHSNSDKIFAIQVGIPFYTPEQFFGQEQAQGQHQVSEFGTISLEPQHGNNVLLSNEEPFQPEKKSEQEMVLLIGPPGSGKTTFAKTFFRGYAHINRDTLVTIPKCVQVASAALASKQSVVIDNTNPSASARLPFLQLAKQRGLRSIRCFVMDTPMNLCKTLNQFRSFIQNKRDESSAFEFEFMDQKKRELVPTIAYQVYNKNYEAPTPSEGFTDIKTVPFVPRFDLFQSNMEALKTVQQFLSN